SVDPIPTSPVLCRDCYAPPLLVTHLLRHDRLTKPSAVIYGRPGKEALSFDTSSSSTSLDSASHTSESSFTTSLQGCLSAQTMLHLHLLQLLDPLGRGVGLQLHPFHLQFTLQEPLLDRADLLPPHKRYRGTSGTHSYESSDEGSPETHVISDMDLDIQADIEVETAAAATTAAATIDGLGIEPDMAVVESGFELGLAVVESESELAEAEADDEADAEIQPEGTIEIRVDVTTRIDIPNDRPMPDTIKRLEQLEESVQDMYGHMIEIPLQRIVVIEAGQTDQQAKNMIVNGERSSLLERVAALKGINTRL
ncbi:hypothetical protein Tco_0530491, partial [Tanacetum coccineum]